MIQTLEFPAPCELINANQRLHWAPKGKRTREWRSATLVRARIEKIKPLDRGSVTVWFSFPDRRRRDCGNLHPTVKAIVDGLVDAEIFSDDRDEIVTAQDARRGPLSTDSRVWVRVEIEGGS